MSSPSQPATYCIGWDVGGWNCDKNSTSRDALVILDAALALVGRPWRGNLRATINAAGATDDWLRRLFALCAAEAPAGPWRATLAIDTPLGFSDAFVRLVTRLRDAGPVGASQTNPYLYRRTERYLFERGLKPLSAIKDMIGSQATKGLHVLARFTPRVQSCGVWTDGARLTAIEAYPSGCKGSATLQALRQGYPPQGHEDLEDALTCALVAHLFNERREALESPGEGMPACEGWIWVPKDGLGPQQDRVGRAKG